MNISDNIRKKIAKLENSYVFTYKDFISEVNLQETIIKCLNRMVISGEIIKLSKGKYYKQQETRFGDIVPEQYQIVKDLLEENGKLIGYTTGMGYFNVLGLTTQVSSIIQIGRNDSKASIKRGRFSISFIKQKNTITKENIPLLRILDAIRLIKKIPDTTVDLSCIRLLSILKKLNNKETERIAKLALKYPPSTQALLGALLEKENKESALEILKKSLNKISTYKYNITKKTLPTLKNWNIQ